MGTFPSRRKIVTMTTVTVWAYPTLEAVLKLFHLKLYVLIN